jgi:hypothetical protein
MTNQPAADDSVSAIDVARAIAAFRDANVSTMDHQDHHNMRAALESYANRAPRIDPSSAEQVRVVARVVSDWYSFRSREQSEDGAAHDILTALAAYLEKGNG